jgi:deoxycytidylate deaminase
MDFRQNSKDDSEIVMALIGPVGCNRNLIVQTIIALAAHYTYKVKRVHASNALIPYIEVPDHKGDEFRRVSNLMKAGNELRERTDDNAIFAKLAAVEINALRSSCETPRTIFLIDSLKRPEEVDELRNIYGDGFFLFAIHASEENRDKYLQDHCHILDEKKRKDLIDKDKNEETGHGQATSDAFHLADFFVAEDGSNTKVWNTMQRFFDLIFGKPFLTPTFNEHAMYMAYVAAMKSADMSRQVGAVVTIGEDIISTGANEVPKPGGGSYWPVFDQASYRIFDIPEGRDYMNGYDKNGQDKDEMISKLKKGISSEALKTLEENINDSGINDLTEFGRVVHAEMDALLGCARRGITCQGSVLYSTTFPCHNCAKHIISSGVRKVVYIEPYPKSRALEGHKEAIRTRYLVRHGEDQKVLFLPFIGVGPKRFVDLFSMTLSSGEKIKRKAKGSFKPVEWNRAGARPRLKMFNTSYIINEQSVQNTTAEVLLAMEKIVITNDG